MRLDPEKLKINIEKNVERDIKENDLFGCAYYVSQDAKTLYRGFFGSVSPSGAPVNENTLFRMASMTKPVVAVAALILVEKGLLSLSDPVKKYLPIFENTRLKGMDGSDLGPVKTDVTVFHLLTHTSGLGDIDPVRPFTKESLETIENYVEFIGGKVYFEPFSAQAYSGTAAFDVLAAIIEKISGVDVETFIKREIFDPLGMKNSYFKMPKEAWDRLIKMHNKIDGLSAACDMPKGCLYSEFPASHMSGGAGLASTLDDYSKFANMLLLGGSYNGARILSEASVKNMATAKVSEAMMPGDERWGLGVRVVTGENYGPLPVGSFGWCGAYGTHFYVDPVNRVAAVFLKNSLYDGGYGATSNRRLEEAVAASFCG